MKIRSHYCNPVILFIVVWTLVVIGALFAPKRFFTDDPVYIFTNRGTVWLILAISSFIIGAHLARGRRILLKYSGSKTKISTHTKTSKTLHQTPLRQSTLIAELLTAGILVILSIFFIRSAIYFGGPIEFLQAVPEQWHTVRRVWPNQKPFPGARLLYTGLIGIAIFSFSGLAVNNNTDIEDHRLRGRLIRLIFVSVGVLAILPIFVSQRLLVGYAIVGGVISYLMISEKSIDAKIPLFGIILGFLVWTTQEVVRGGFSPDGIVASLVFSVQRLLWYFGNNLRNVMMGVEYTPEHAYGLLSLDFLFEFTFTSKIVNERFLGDFHASTSGLRGGGTWTGLGVPFMDFGWAGLLLLGIFGYIAYRAYVLAKENFLMAQIYGLIGAMIVFSFQHAGWSSPDIWFPLIVIVIIFRPPWIFGDLANTERGYVVD